MFKSVLFKFIVAIAFLVGLSHDAFAQVGVGQEPPETIGLSGPRFGVTYLSDGVRRKLNDAGIDIHGEFLNESRSGVGSVVTQFGWQWEKGFLASNKGITGVTEWVLLFGGVEQGVVIPSFSWLLGLRTMKGVEFAVGPNVTPAGIAMAAAAGVTFSTGNLNIPVNLAVVPSKSGVRVSMLAGFNMRR
jgi:hypothetical protein